MAKLDIYNLQWIDVVFAGRNKEYGAYELRKNDPKTRTKALLIGGSIFIVLVCSPMIINLVKGIVPEEKIVQTEVTLSAPPPVDEKTPPPPPPPPEPPRPQQNQVKFPPPVVVPAAQAEEPPTVEELKVADPGQKTIAGDPNAEIVIDEPVGEAPKEAAVTEDNSIHDFTAVEKLPAFPGGDAGFAKFIQANYNYSAAARENGVSGSVVLSFIVEKDGSLVDIKVIRDLGMGTGEEAQRVLKKMPKWSPGIQNGRPVRVSYTLPLRLRLEVN